MTQSPVQLATVDRPEPTAVQRRAMWYAIAQASAVAPGYLAYTNGLLLLFLTAMGVSNERIVLYLALPAAAQSLVMVPAAYVADRIGKRAVGVLGICLEVLGFVCLALAPSLPEGAVEPVALAGIVSHSVGATLYVSSWFALLAPIVPEATRGRFFGRLRLSWQFFCIVFIVACAFALSATSPMYVFQFVMAGIAALLVLRVVAYLNIPELEREHPSEGFIESTAAIMRGEGFMSFSAYVFVLMLFTGACPVLFGLVEKDTLRWGDDRILWMGNLYMIGAVAGFAVGGRMVDRWGTKLVFMMCHFGYGLLMIAFLGRSVLPQFTVPAVGAVNFLFGAVWAASTIAISTELLALIPAHNKSLATSLCIALQRTGAALSSVLVSQTLQLGVLRDQWVLGGQTLSDYDALLMAGGVMVILMVVTLGLVPSVLRKAEWLPRQV